MINPIEKPEIPMPLDRWHWPFKTPEERKLVVAYYKRLQAWEKYEQLYRTEEAPF
jgi:hypothetical protein